MDGREQIDKRLSFLDSAAREDEEEEEECSDHGHIASSPCAHYFDPRIVVIVLRHADLTHVCCSVTPSKVTSR